MPPDIRIHVHTQGGDTHPIETPLDIKAEDFAKELVIGLNLPTEDAEGHQVTWTIDDKDTGRTLEYPRTLEENGVCEGHHLYIRRRVTAGR